ncbi:MAG TPA: lipid kinase YegS [Pseudomonas sp.]|uniref:lipid kinase YegS n=1 Tax=Pseudomonas sp. TaxID=306 RepID=UPI002C275FDB|nr:lipid kinase YegS [Pseudomonas sp.]HTO19706.1 lipid kinase YegS [Pseudomonas sp.]
MERRAWLILHGKQAQNEAVREAVQARRDDGWDLAVRLTWEAGDARRLVEEGLRAGYSRLIAGGGDGTLNEVATALIDLQGAASLALLPLGSANDFARAAQIPLEPAAALDLLAVEATPVDLGMANERLFVNMATGGFGSLVTANTSEELKKVLGGGAYLLTGITRFAEVRSAFGRFHGPDFDWQGDFLALGIGNGRQAGGGHALCPNATITDGLLDLCLIPAPQDVGETLRVLLGGGMLGLDAVAITARLPWLEVEAPAGLDLNLDGEPLHSARVRFAVRRQALRLHLPADSPLLTGAVAD